MYFTKHKLFAAIIKSETKPGKAWVMGPNGILKVGVEHNHIKYRLWDLPIVGGHVQSADKKENSKSEGWEKLRKDTDYPNFADIYYLEKDCFPRRDSQTKIGET